MDLSDLRAALRRYWVVALLAMAFWLLVGGAMSFLPQPQYRADSTVAVFAGPDLTDPVSQASFQIPIIVETIQSRTFRQGVEASLPAADADAEVAVVAAADSGTGIIRIEVEGPSPDADAAWATAIARAAVARPDAAGLELQIIDVADVPSTPISPKVLPILIGTGMLGLLSAVLASVVVARVRKALDLEEEIQRRLGLPVIGHIPATRALHRAPNQSAAEVLAGTPELMEAFKTLRTNLELLLLDSPQSSVLAVVSWGEGEGKSTVAAGIALTMSMSDHDVVAIDADLRHPQLHTRLGQPFGEGLADVPRRSVGKVVGPTEHDHLWFLPAGIPDRHPADLLPVAIASVLDYCHTVHRRVVVDCPPFHGVAETAMVLAAAQTVVLVIDGRKTKLPELEAMTSRLQLAGVNIAGVVLNRVSRSKVLSAYPSYDASAVRRSDVERLRPREAIDVDDRDASAVPLSSARKES